MERYMDTNLSAEERARLLLEDLSLEEKMAQIVGMFAIKGYEDQIAAYMKHGIGQISTLFFREEKSKAAAAAWQRQLQQLIMDNSPHHIPAVFHMEGLCGAFIQDSTAFPSGIARGSSFDPELERKIGEIVSRQEAAYAFTQILAPVLDISRDSRMGRQGEPYGEDPTLAAAMGTAYTKGIQETETAGRRPESVAKHFLGFHNSQGGIHGADVQGDDHLLLETYGKSFQAAIHDGGLKGIMPCYGSIGGRPIHTSKHFLTDILRGEMGFDGVVVSDYGGLDNAFKVTRVGETAADTGLMGLKAGMDVELPMPTCYTAELQEAFATGTADIAVLDQAVLRILTAKFRMGLFEHPFSLEGAELESTVNQPEDDAISRQSAAEGLVLLKNDGILPLDGSAKTIAVIGPQAVNARYYFGGYTHISMVESARSALNSMAGIGAGGDAKAIEAKRIPGTYVEDDEAERFYDVLTQLEPNARTLLDVLKEALPDTRILHAAGYPIFGADDSGFEEALELCTKADIVLLTLGGKYSTGSIATMGEGVDATDINLPEAQEAFIRAAATLGKPMIGIHFDGRPISSDAADACLNAILEAWSPATFAAEVITDVLLGRTAPSGKLPVSVAYNAGQIPVYYNHLNGSAWHQAMSIGFQDYVDCPHKPRYPFGHGLTYTTFAYSDLQLDAAETAPDVPVTVSCKIKNTGDRAGTEIVQLYLSDPHASMTRPNQELQGFARVSLEPGEEKTVSFTIAPSLMAFTDEDMRWKIEKGDIDVRVGASSDDIRLEGSFRITEDKWILGKERKFCAEAKIG